MVDKALENIPLERLLAELRARAGLELPAHDLSALSSQQLAVVIQAASSRASAVPVSLHGEIDFTPRAQVQDPEVLKDMESVALVFFVANDGDGAELEIPTRIFNKEYPLCHPAPFQLSRIVMGASSDERAVHIISHPRGMPAQYAPNARVGDNTAPGIFKADVDGLGGSSGAPIFDAQTHQIEGIYFKGLKDWDALAVCSLLNQAAPQALGEDIVRITELAPYIPILH